MIPQSFIQELLARVDIVEVIDRRVKLKRAGSNYVACCPFHSEKTPSFTVSPSKQFYHCFGCGAHGTAIGFLMEYGAMGFVEAVQELAHAAGLKVPETQAETAVRAAGGSEALYEVLLKAARFYRERLKESPRAIAYLRNRGLTGEIAARFGIGYAPEGWHGLAAAFPQYEAPTLAAAGLVRVSEDGRRYDVFRDRIMFPIVDLRGNVVGFGGRVLEPARERVQETEGSEGRGSPKYLNSPETAVFSKGRELYGLYQARRAIREAGRVLVVEGYLDVVALAQHGLDYSVATLGTATTPLHVERLLRQSDELVFCFDGDEAGRRAAWRALENALGALSDGKQVRFLFLPEGEDPDSYVRGRGRAAFEALLAQAVPLSRLLLEGLAARADRSTAEGRARMIHEARPLLGQIRAPLLRGQIVRELARGCEMTPEEIECALGPVLPSARERGGAPVPPRAAPRSLARALLRVFLSRPELAAALAPQERELLAVPELAPVAEIVEAVRAGGAQTPAALLEATRESRFAALYREVAADTLDGEEDPEAARQELAGALARLELAHVQSEYQRLAASGTRDEAERQRFRELSRRLAELKGAAREAPGRAAAPRGD